MTLEERIRAAVKSGNLLHLSISRKWDGSVWQAGYRNADNCNVQYVEDEDPIVAMEKAIRPLRSAPPPVPQVTAVKPAKKSRRKARDEDLI